MKKDRDMENEVNEVWLPVKGYEGLYEVSNLGRVKSLEKKVDYHFKIAVRKERIMSLANDKDGYKFIYLKSNGSKKMKRVHRLVYEAFIGEIPEGLVINHINEIKYDNRPENLNLMTSKENTNYGGGIEKCRQKRINHPNLSMPCKCIETNVIYPSASEASRQTGIRQGNISLALKRGANHTAGGYHWKYNN